MPDNLDKGYGNAAAPAERPTLQPETSEFVQLLKSRERGKLKVYIGSAAGTGKTYRMLSEAHDLRRRGVDHRPTPVVPAGTTTLPSSRIG